MNKGSSSRPTVGVLALQGDFAAHRRVLEDQLGVAVREVRRPADLAVVDSLILPGGESTTMSMLLERIALTEPIRERARAGMPVYGTCAGMILMANGIEDRPEQPTLGLMDITVARNAFGRQVDSFEADIPLTGELSGEIHAVFIRAPYVTRTGPHVEVIATFQDKVVGVRQGNRLATAFHPELTDSTALHVLFSELTARSEEKRG